MLPFENYCIQFSAYFPYYSNLLTQGVSAARLRRQHMTVPQSIKWTDIVFGSLTAFHFGTLLISIWLQFLREIFSSTPLEGFLFTTESRNTQNSQLVIAHFKAAILCKPFMTLRYMTASFV
jgi:hypothetical protein